MHGVASSTFYDVRKRRSKAIDSEYADAIHFADDTAELQTMSDEFYAANKQSLEGSVLAVDGLLVKIKQRTSRDTRNPVAYYTRKGFHALNVQVGCDAAACVFALSTHDSLAWGNTNAAELLESGGVRLAFSSSPTTRTWVTTRCSCPGPEGSCACAFYQGRIQLSSDRVRTETVPHFPARSATFTSNT